MVKYTKYGEIRFHWVDYLVFFSMVIFATGFGIFFALRKSKRVAAKRARRTVGSAELDEYLLGSGALKPFPVAMSLVGSYISGVTMLGTPSEIYNYGTQYFLVTVSVVCASIVVAMVYLPVFVTLNVSSSYEYLNLRFSRAMRNMASCLFLIDEMFFLPIILWVPSLAFNQATGIDETLVAFVICTGTVIYTLLGGIKAVVHTDAWQIMIMFLAMIAIAILGTIYAGGFGPVFSSASEGGRLIFFNFSMSMFERHTFWSVLIGCFSYWTSFNSVNQTMVQRFLSLPNLRSARIAIIIFTLGILLFLLVCLYAGLLIYNYYKECDPLTYDLVKKDDQLLPVYVMQITGQLYGIPGLFIAGVFGAALSSLSVVLNASALVFYQDFVKSILNKEPSPRMSRFLVKGCIIVLGVISMCFIFVLEKLEGILSVCTSLTAIASSATFGVFTLGMLIPWSNNTGAMVGAATSVILTGWITIGQFISTNDQASYRLPISVDGCTTNSTNPIKSWPDGSNVFPLYRLSFLWINPIGVCTTVIVGTIVSLSTKPTKLTELDARLISPFLHRFLPEESFENMKKPDRLLGDIPQK